MRRRRRAPGDVGGHRPSSGGRGRGSRYVGGCRASGDRGSGTVLLLGAVAALLTLTIALAALVQATRVRGQAQTAADLAALAAATALHAGTEPPCAAAAHLADANAATLERCDVTGGVVTVHVTARGATLTAQTHARAGPA